MKALIIKDPYISYILDGQKTWEMRSTSTKQRGLIALIKKGTGKIWGIARLVDAKGPLERDVIVREADKHRIPVEEILSGAVDKWNYAWVIGDVVVLPEPIPYHHPNGAVIWVTLDENVADEVMAFAEGDNHRKNADEEVSARSNSAATLQVPFARDGTFFGPETRNSKGLYRVGSKDNERVFKSFSDALDYLKCSGIVILAT